MEDKRTRAPLNFCPNCGAKSPAKGTDRTRYDFSQNEVGDRIYFGQYPQESGTAESKQPIEWRVLDKQDGKLLVISDKGFVCQPYHNESENITWERCYLRKWPNKEFVKTAFSKEEAKMIAVTKVHAHQNLEYDTDSEQDTEDNVFLLSLQETKKYFKSDKDRGCRPTVYSEANGADADTGNCCWWLRSPISITVSGDIFTSCVDEYGSVGSSLALVTSAEIGVRPALWIREKP